MRYLTAGESHGPQLTAILEGLPAGMPYRNEDINDELSRRQKGYGRGRRMQIEKDTVEIVHGVRHGYTLGSPIALVVKNDDWKHWTKYYGAEPLSDKMEEEVKRKITRPRPGHADLNGAIKYGHRDMRNVLERSSATRDDCSCCSRSCRKKVVIVSWSNHCFACSRNWRNQATSVSGVGMPIDVLKEQSETSPVRCIDDARAQQMMAAIDTAKTNGDSIGGVVEVIVTGMPSGIGSYVHYDRKLDAKIAAAIVSINAFKGVEFGIGFEAARKPGSEVHDEIAWSNEAGYYSQNQSSGWF